VVYVVAARALFFYERRSQAAGGSGGEADGTPLRRAAFTYIVAAIFVAAAGALPFAGLELAETMGWATASLERC
jgi:cation:H+ antiporter